MKSGIESALCQATATLLSGHIEFANDFAQVAEVPVNIGAIDAMEKSASRYRERGCGLHIENVAEQIAGCSLRCTQVETGECPLLIVGVGDSRVAAQLGVPHRTTTQDFDFVA